MRITLLVLSSLFLALGAQASEVGHKHVSKYAGEARQAIKSLSPADIRELKRGGGWGLAKAAELNGVPGPVHLLELKDKIPLDPAQVSAITQLYNRMKVKAVEQGERLITLETALEGHFRDGTITDAILQTSLEAIAAARRQLRYIHLATHLQTPKILSAHQIRSYNTLRGYGAADPCANVPQGHNAARWRKHNHCE